LALEIGRLMARYCIAYDTVKLFASVNGQESLEELVRLYIQNVNYLRLL